MAIAAAAIMGPLVVATVAGLVKTTQGFGLTLQDALTGTGLVG